MTAIIPVLRYKEEVTIDRRTFLAVWGGLPALSQTRDVIRGIGPVAFCRASRESVRWLPLVLDGAPPVCERIDRDELVLCGTEATLVIDRQGWRRFA
jgi:hypothetical protein